MENLTDEEEAFLTGVTELTGEKLTYTVPDIQNADGNVTVDAEAKTVEVIDTKEFKAIAAYVVVDGARVETITLTDNKGAFISDAQIYSIEVDYAYNEDVATEEQSTLLEAVYYLSEAVENFDAVADLASSIDLIASADFLGELYKFATDGYTIIIGGTAYDATWTDCYSKTYVKEMYEEKEDNKGTLYIQDYINDYQEADSKVQYIIEEGEIFKTEAEDFYTIMERFVNETNGTTEMLTAAKTYNSSYEALFDIATDTMKNTESSLKVALNGVWSTDADGTLDYDKYFQDNVSDYEGIDDLVRAATDESSAHEEDNLVETLLVDTVTITANVAQYNVNVEVVGYKYVDGVKTDLPTYEETLVLQEDATKSEIEAAIAEADIATSALAQADWGLETEHYTVTTLDVPDELVADTTVTIQYEPSEYTVTYTGETTDSVSKEYGETVVFASHEDDDQSYDYTTEDGKIYNQGDVYTVSGKVSFTVSVGKAKEENNVKDLVAETYSTELGDYANVLTSVAIYSDTVKFRTPDNEDGLLILDDTENTITAQTYQSGIEGSTWIPTTVNIVDGKNTTSYSISVTEGVYFYKITETSYDRVEVIYKLVIDEDIVSKTDIQGYLDIPYGLKSDLDTQVSHMDSLVSQKSTLEDIPVAQLSFLESIMKDTSKYNFTQESIDAMGEILSVAVNSNKELVLLEYIDGYKADGIIYYYKNYEAIIEQVETLRDGLNTIITNDKDDLIKLIDELDMNGYDSEELVGQLEEALTNLEDIQLVEPNTKVINMNSSSLSALLTTLQGLDASDKSVTADTLITKNTSLSVTASNKATVTVNVQVKNSDGDTISTKSNSYTTNKGVSYSDDDIAKMKAMVTKLITDTGISTAYYEVTDYELPEENTEAATKTITITYTPKSYEVQYVDEDGDVIETDTFYYDEPVVVLKASENSGIAYEYVVDGADKRVTSDTEYRFNDTQITSLFANGTYIITRKEIDIYQEDILAFVDEANDHTSIYTEGGKEYLQVAYIPVEDESGTTGIVVRISPTAEIDTDAIFSSLGNAILDKGYTYVEIGGEAFVDGTTISVQAFIDALLNSGISLDSISDVIDDDGDIVEMMGTYTTLDAFSNEKVQDTDLYGGKIIETTLTLASSAEDEAKATPVYITIEDFDKEADTLKDTKESIAVMQETIDFEAVDGELCVSLNLSDEYYTTYVALMLLTSEMDLQEFNKALANDEVAGLLNANVELLEPLFAEGVTVEYLENTLTELGMSGDLSALSTYYDFIGNMDLTFVSSEGNVSDGTMTYDISALVSGLDSLPVTIKEQETGVTIPVEFTYENLGETYEAAIVSTSSIMTSTLTTNLGSTSIADGTTVILLKDISGNLSFNSAITLDLNGYTVDGNIQTTSTLTIIDSRLETKSGAVTGSLTQNQEGDIIIYGGEYETANIKEMIPLNYEQDSEGYVVSSLFNIEETEDTINVQVNAEVLNSFEVTNIQEIATSLVYDIVLNCYNDSSITIGENTIYSVDIDDIGNFDAAQLIEEIDADATSAFINAFLADLTDFDTVVAAIENDQPISSYDLTTTDLAMGFVPDEEETKFDIQLTNNGETTTKTLAITIVGTDEEKAAVVDTFHALIASKTSITTTVDIDSFDYTNGAFSYEYTLGLLADSDLSVTNDYAYMLGIMVYQELSNSKDELNLDIKDAITHQSIADLKKAMEAVDAQVVVDAIISAADTSYADMMDGFSTYDYEDEYTTMYHLAGHLFDALFSRNITGTDFGDYLVAGTYGAYELVDTEGITTYDVTLDIFDEPNTDVVAMNDKDQVLYSGSNIGDAFGASGVSKVVVNVPVSLSEDYTFTKDIEITGVENITFGDYRFIVADNGTTITADASIKDYILVKDATYEVKESVADGVYTYSFTKYAVVATDKDGAIKYVGTSVQEAFTTAGVEKVEINGAVTLTGDVVVSNDLDVVGMSNVTFDSYKFIINGENIIITSDADVEGNVQVVDGTYFMNSSQVGENYTYSATKYDVAAKNADGTILYTGSDLVEAINTAGTTNVEVSKSVTLTADVTVDSSIQITGASNISAGSYKLILEDTAVTIQSDASIQSMIQVEDSTYEVIENVSDGVYTYSIAKYAVVATDANGTVKYTGSNLATALETSGVDTITINENVSITANVKISSDIKLVGTSNISFGGYTFTIGGENITLTTDSDIESYIATNSAYEIKVTGAYKYSIEYVEPSVDETTVTIDSEKGTIRGAAVDEEKGMIVIDVSFEGISESELQTALDSDYTGTTKTVVFGNLTSDGLIKTGSTYTVTAKNTLTGETDVKVYTIIVLGDVNSDGLSNAFDAYMITQVRLGDVTASELQSLAGDANNDGSVNAFDSTKIINKRLEEWSNNTYQSALSSK